VPKLLPSQVVPPEFVTLFFSGRRRLPPQCRGLRPALGQLNLRRIGGLCDSLEWGINGWHRRGPVILTPGSAAPAARRHAWPPRPAQNSPPAGPGRRRRRPGNMRREGLGQAKDGR
jgi:hypothetical protein